MRSATIVVALAAAAAAAHVQPRQVAAMDMSSHGSMSNPSKAGSPAGGLEALGPLLANPALLSLAGDFMPKKEAYKIEQIKPKLRSDAKRVRIIYGPYELKGKNSKAKVGNSPSMDPAGTSYAHLASSDFPRDVTVLEAASFVALEDFERALGTDGIYNHHNVFFDFSVKVPEIMTCSNPDVKPKGAYPVSVFMAGATEAGMLQYTSSDGQFKSGYYIGPKDVIYNGLDVVNYNNDNVKIYTISEMEYMPGKVEGALRATQQTIDLGLCDGPSGVEIHPDASVRNLTINGRGIMINEDGYLLNTRGHLHDGGVGMVIEINGKVACDSRVLYGGPGFEYTLKDGTKVDGIRETTRCDAPIEVTKGDKLNIVAKYDFDVHPQRETANGEMADDMALLLVTFVTKQKM